jgi:hypothetical protein
MSRIGTKISRAFFVLIVATRLGGNAAMADPGTTSSVERGVELGLVVSAIEKALDEAAQNPVEGFPPLQSVNVEVTTTTALEYWRQGQHEECKFNKF